LKPEGRVKYQLAVRKPLAIMPKDGITGRQFGHNIERFKFGIISVRFQSESSANKDPALKK